MPPADIDALFDDGAQLGQGVVAKAQLRFRVHPPRHRSAQDLVDRVVAAYDERIGMIVDEVAEVLRHAGGREESGPLVLEVSPTVAKATPRAPFRPGSRGGKWYRDSRGNVRYGDPPEGRFMGNAGQDSPMAHVDHLRPRAFMGGFDGDQALTGFLIDGDDQHGFSDGELRFLGTWYGTGEDGGELFDAFLECAGITRDDVKDGTTHLRFGAQQLTYEEAVFEFFAAQGALFMGEEPTSTGDVAEWHRVLNDDVKPLIDGVFAKYEELKEDEEFQKKFAGEPDRQRRRFFDAARRSEESTRGVADAVTGGWNPVEQVDAVVSGLRDLGLFARPARAERRAYLHGRPHLRDAVAMDGRLVGGGPKNPLLAQADALGALTASQLMLLYAAAELHRRWDPHTKSFSAEAQSDSGSGDLGEAALAALEGKTPQWAEAFDTARDRLEELVDRLVVRLNEVNAREGLPTKHGPARKPRKR